MQLHSVFLSLRLSSGDKVYLNLSDHTHSWRTPSNYQLRSQFLTASDIDNVVREVNEEFDSRHAFNSIMVRFQARSRGFLVRQKLFSMLQYYYENETKVVKVQSLWRGRKVRLRFSASLQTLKQKRMRSLNHYRKHVNQIVLIQRMWRAKKARNEFRKFLESNNVHKNMDVETVRKFLHLLDLRPEDFSSELELQNLKAEITKKIRLIHGLEKDLDSMDIKIGLLVKNRIDAEEVVAHGKHMNRRIKEKKNPGIFIIS